jgi:hypothetical protein
MSTAETQTNRLPSQREREREEVKSAEVVAGGSMVEAIAGAAAVVLAIVGLASQGWLSTYLVSIATIAVGAALVSEGAAIAGRYSRLLHETGGSRTAMTEMGGGMSVEILGGLAGIALGILALLGLAQLTLISVAAIVFGGTLLLSSGTTTRLNCLVIESHPWPDTARQVAREGVRAAAGVQVLVGLGGGVLGLLALLGVYPVELTLVAMLCLGGAILLSGAAISGKMLSVLHH